MILITLKGAEEGFDHGPLSRFSTVILPSSFELGEIPIDFIFFSKLAELLESEPAFF